MLRVYTDAIFQTTHSFMLASGQASMIDFDRTFIAQMVLFVVLMLILAPTLFGPVLRLFEERERRTEGARTEARQMQEKAVQLLARYEDELGRVQQVAAAEREKLRNETLRLEAKILEEARQATVAIVEEGRKTLQVETAKIRTDLQTKSQQISQEVARTVLGREVRP
jgi:F-type H+-transporting ATPase subunit b